ncbi:alpha/beta hydrolase [Sphingomonas limnosediminicola]|uniref:Alpha/beta hydrolase n=1 Tax=Sphingomonas limnosediminicola TaxID=940133 RepID=A0ABP7LM62_9SPHN
MRKVLLGLASVASLIFAAFTLSPWPSVYAIRLIFDKGAANASAKLEKHVPASVTASTYQYDPSSSDALLDVYRPAKSIAGAPTVVWIHGGGFVSGRRSDLTNYAKILAGQGFNVVNIDYTIAPEAHYPTPIRQVNQALAFLTRNGGKLGVDSNRLVLAGDSAGAQIAAQSAAVVTDADYARRVGVSAGARPSQIIGALLFCGVFDVTRTGSGWFMKTTTWAYSGKRNWRDAPGFETISVASNVSRNFPPSFISAGNADPLASQSLAMADALKAKGVSVDTLFYPADYKPPLGHEYQFDLDTAAGRLALERSTRWLRALVR